MCLLAAEHGGFSNKPCWRGHLEHTSLVAFIPQRLNVLPSTSLSLLGCCSCVDVCVEESLVSLATFALHETRSIIFHTAITGDKLHTQSYFCREHFYFWNQLKILTFLTMNVVKLSLRWWVKGSRMLTGWLCSHLLPQLTTLPAKPESPHSGILSLCLGLRDYFCCCCCCV